MNRGKGWLIAVFLVASHCVKGQSVVNGNFDIRDTLITIYDEVPGEINQDTLFPPVHVRTTSLYYPIASVPSDVCKSAPGCSAFTPFSIVGAIKRATSCLMLELDRPLKIGELYMITVHIKPLCADRSYPPHPNFGIKLSDISIAETPSNRILRNGWRTALDTIPGTVCFFDPKALRCEAKGPFTCPGWKKYDFDIVATGGERYIYLSVFGEIPATDLWDDQKKIRRLVHQFNKSRSAKRSSKVISQLRAFFPWPPDEVSNIELVFFASTWRYQTITDATYLIDDVSITIKE